MNSEISSGEFTKFPSFDGTNPTYSDFTHNGHGRSDGVTPFEGDKNPPIILSKEHIEYIPEQET